MIFMTLMRFLYLLDMTSLRVTLHHPLKNNRKTEGKYGMEKREF